MDLTQRKLNRDEWNSIEIKVEDNEVDVLKMISDGYSNENILYNYNTSIINFLKIPYNEGIEYLIYDKYFKNIIEKEIKKYELNFNIENNFKKVHVKKADTMRLNIKDKLDDTYVNVKEVVDGVIKTSRIYGNEIPTKVLMAIQGSLYERGKPMSQLEIAKEWVKFGRPLTLKQADKNINATNIYGLMAG